MKALRVMALTVRKTSMQYTTQSNTFRPLPGITSCSIDYGWISVINSWRCCKLLMHGLLSELSLQYCIYYSILCAIDAHKQYSTITSKQASHCKKQTN